MPGLPAQLPAYAAGGFQRLQKLMGSKWIAPAVMPRRKRIPFCGSYFGERLYVFNAPVHGGYLREKFANNQCANELY